MQINSPAAAPARFNGIGMQRILRIAALAALLVGATVTAWWLIRASTPSVEAPLVTSKVSATASQVDPEVPATLSRESPTEGTLIARKLGALAESPEAYVNSAQNPYACPAMQTGLGCDWERDRMVARSPGEARWMAAQGYPTLRQREWASQRSAEQIINEAKRLNSAALWALGLEKKVQNAATPAEAQELSYSLARLATQAKSLYAMEQFAYMQLHVLELEVAASGWAPASSESRARISEARGRASMAALESALLGDAGAVDRIDAAMTSIPGFREAGNSSLDAMRLTTIDSHIRHFHNRLLQQSRLVAQGLAKPEDGFMLADIRPRPMVSNVIGDGRPGGMWIGEP